MMRGRRIEEEGEITLGIEKRGEGKAMIKGEDMIAVERGRGK